MNITARLKRIEKSIYNRKPEVVWVNECNCEYYIEKDGKKIVIKNPKTSFPDKLIFIEKNPL